MTTFRVPAAVHAKMNQIINDVIDPAPSGLALAGWRGVGGAGLKPLPPPV